MTGFPKAMVFDLTSFVTTLPTPIKQLSFRVIPQTIVELAPIETLSFNKSGNNFSSLQLPTSGYKSFVK